MVFIWCFRTIGTSAKTPISMNNSIPPVFFFLPSQALINNVPETIDDYWNWINEAVRISPAKLGTRNIPCTWLGPYNWVIQTFMYLRSSGFPCELSASLPDEGIIITHGDFLPRFLKPIPRRFIVEIKPDRPLQCAHANFVIVQNRHDPICRGISSLFVKAAFVNYWPQPGLIPRDVTRKDRFENICFMGNPEQFIGEVDVLESEINKLGLHWKMIPRERWHDYREVDAIVAVRPADSLKTGTTFMKRLFRKITAGTHPALSSDRKPASKLLNAWAAGTPAIVSPDDAFKDLRASDLDYLVAHNVQEIIQRLKQLRDDPALRRAMTEHGRERAGEYVPETIIPAWRSVISGQIVPEYIIWTGSSVRRNLFFFVRAVAYKARML